MTTVKELGELCAEAQGTRVIIKTKSDINGEYRIELSANEADTLRWELERAVERAIQNINQMRWDQLRELERPGGVNVKIGGLPG